MLLHHLLDRSAARTPDAAAAIDGRGTISYGELARRANQIARLLIGSGVGPGDRVLLALENSAEWTACYFGILEAGGVAVPLAHGARSDRLHHALADCAPSLAILDAAAADLVVRLGAGSRLPAILVPGRALHTHRPDGRHPSVLGLEESLDGLPAGDVSVPRTEDDLAAIIYTSGSTGTPRGVMLSHRNIRANTESIVDYLHLSSSDRVMVVLPFYYVYGLSLLNTHVSAGGAVVIDNRFAFPISVLKGIQQHEVTGFAGVPSTFAILLHRSPMATMTFPTLRYVTQAGGAMAPALVQKWRQAMPHVPLYVMYGATEASARLAYLDPAELGRRLGSIGRAIPNVELTLIKENGAVARPGEVGEIVARGANVSSGYWNAPEETRAAFGPAGYRTGDLATSDEDGFLYLVGRRHDMLKIGAHRVGAKEIEDVLYDHPAVHEAAVIGAPHELLGEVPIAFVALREGHPADGLDMLAFCRRRLPEHKVPARIVVRDELPKTGAGKIDKRSLQQAADGAPVPL